MGHNGCIDPLKKLHERLAIIRKIFRESEKEFQEAKCLLEKSIWEQNESIILREKADGMLEELIDEAIANGWICELLPLIQPCLNEPEKWAGVYENIEMAQGYALKESKDALKALEEAKELGIQLQEAVERFLECVHCSCENHKE